MGTSVDEVKDAILAAVKKNAGKFLDDHQDARDFVVDRAKRLAKLAVDYKLAGDEDERKKLKEQMEVVQLSIENELSSVAVDAAVQSRETFKAVLGTAVDILVKALPTVISAL